MEPRDALLVEIVRDGEPATFCSGPDGTGACPRLSADQTVVPCAGARLHVRPVGDDLWVFLTPVGGDCPLSWLVTGPRATADDGAVFPIWPRLF